MAPAPAAAAMPRGATMPEAGRKNRAAGRVRSTWLGRVFFACFCLFFFFLSCFVFFFSFCFDNIYLHAGYVVMLFFSLHGVETARLSSLQAVLFCYFVSSPFVACRECLRADTCWLFCLFVHRIFDAICSGMRRAVFAVSRQACCFCPYVVQLPSGVRLEGQRSVVQTRFIQPWWCK